MKERKYIIGTGYHSKKQTESSMVWLFELWMANTFKYASPKAIYVIRTGEGMRPNNTYRIPVIWCNILGDLGYCGDIIAGTKPYHFCGGTFGVLTLAMFAYLNECDFVHKEQDLLAFGDYINAMYDQIGSHGCIFGNSRAMMSTQSLMLVKHGAIPKFVEYYLGTPHEKDADQIGETKFARLQSQHPDFYCRYNFGYDRDRPINFDDQIWYAQKLTLEEMAEIKKRGLIDQELPHEHRSHQFTNYPMPKRNP